MILPSVKKLEQKYSRKTIRLTDYSSLMNTRRLGGFEIYDWFPYTQRFTSKFLRKMFEHEEFTESRTILDPFMGSGNTLLACLEYGKTSYGVDISPLFWFITKVKTSRYHHEDFEEAINAVRHTKKKPEGMEIPALTSFRRLFTKKRLHRLLAIHEAAYDLNQKARELLLFTLGSELLRFSRARRYGKGLHLEGTIKPLQTKKVITKKLKKMEETYCRFYENLTYRFDPVPLLGDARELNRAVNPSGKSDAIPLGEIDAILTSPPYCNSSDYIEMYKLEHWFLGYIKTYEEFRNLSYSAIRSHTTFSDRSIKWKHPVIEDIYSHLEEVKIPWDSRIPAMIRGYFDDLYASIQQMRDALRPGGVAFIVVGNSSFAKTPIPTDLLVAEIAKELKFKVVRIEILRELPTSGQQWGKLDPESKGLLRESIVVLRNTAY